MPSDVAAAWRAFYGNALKLYGVTPDQYRLLYVAQKGRCWICRKATGIHPDDPKGGGSRRLGVDHDHLTGEVRGLLCTGSLSANTCNRLIARYSRAALQRAADYLTDPPARVLKEARKVASETDAAGAPWTREEADRLAVALLWAGDGVAPEHVELEQLRAIAAAARAYVTFPGGEVISDANEAHLQELEIERRYEALASAVGDEGGE